MGKIAIPDWFANDDPNPPGYHPDTGEEVPGLELKVAGMAGQAAVDDIASDDDVYTTQNAPADENQLPN